MGGWGVRGRGVVGDDKGTRDEVLFVPEPPLVEIKKEKNKREAVNTKFARLVHSPLQTVIYILSGLRL